MEMSGGDWEVPLVEARLGVGWVGLGSIDRRRFCKTNEKKVKEGEEEKKKKQKRKRVKGETERNETSEGCREGNGGRSVKAMVDPRLEVDGTS